MYVRGDCTGRHDRVISTDGKGIVAEQSPECRDRRDSGKKERRENECVKRDHGARFGKERLER